MQRNELCHNSNCYLQTIIHIHIYILIRMEVNNGNESDNWKIGKQGNPKRRI